MERYEEAMLDMRCRIDDKYAAYSMKGKIYVEQKYDLAIKQYERGIALKEIDPEGAAYCYQNRATQYERLREYDKALADLDSTVALSQKTQLDIVLEPYFIKNIRKIISKP